MAESSFVIGGTDFGIETNDSSFVIDTSDSGQTRVTVEVRGDKSTYEKLTSDKESEWAWLGPPHFYLRDFPAKIEASLVGLRANIDDVAQYEFAIYMGEHNDVDDATVIITQGKTLNVEGVVDIFGKRHNFLIHWSI